MRSWRKLSSDLFASSSLGQWRRVPIIGCSGRLRPGGYAKEMGTFEAVYVPKCFEITPALMFWGCIGWNYNICVTSKKKEVKALLSEKRGKWFPTWLLLNPSTHELHQGFLNSVGGSREASVIQRVQSSYKDYQVCRQSRPVYMGSSVITCAKSYAGFLTLLCTLCPCRMVQENMQHRETCEY